MGRDRIHTTELARLLNSADQPMYVLDNALTIVFFNKAFRQCFEAASDELIGLRCAYHSQSDATGPKAMAAGLCPPPMVLTGRVVIADISFIPPEGPPQNRRAKFIPLGIQAEDLVGVVALVDCVDSATPADDSPSASAHEADALDMHEQIRRFRKQAGLCIRADRLVGRSPAAHRIRRQVEVAAASRCSVLLVGPAGSGRRYTALAIHYGSDPESAGSLIPLDCAVLGAELIGTTIMALSTGNPLSADRTRRTLLLAQVDRLYPDVQVELAGMLLGRSFPLRLMATAEQPLAELVRRGRFHEELASVLSTLTIEMPPLAARREDLPMLAQALLEEVNSQGDKQVGGFSTEALDRLDAYHWPGNLDELANVVAEAHERAGGREIGAGDLPERLHLVAVAVAHLRRPEESIVLDDFLERIQRELIRRAIAQSKGNKAKAARLLGLTRPKLYRRMVLLGLIEGEKGEAERMKDEG
jgi:DNA-binding NtrC family response regulator